jgi:hypothetical protein
METISVEIINKKALHILKDMEQQHLIRLKKDDNNPAHKKMSFAGKLHLTDKQYQNFSNYAKNVRNEWEHRI